MDVTPDREVFKNKLYFAGIFLEQLLKLRHQPRTVTSLKVTEHHDDHRCLVRAFRGRAQRINFMDKVKCDYCHCFILPAGGKQPFSVRADLNLIDMRADPDGIRQVSIPIVDQNVAVIGEDKGQIAVLGDHHINRYSIRCQCFLKVNFNSGKDPGCSCQHC